MSKNDAWRIKEPQKFSVGQQVEVTGWTGSDLGTVQEIEPTFHRRMREWVWGYKIEYEGKGAGLALEFVPEGYISMPVSILGTAN